jgi:hypothetical protein
MNTNKAQFTMPFFKHSNHNQQMQIHYGLWIMSFLLLNRPTILSIFVVVVVEKEFLCSYT